MLMLFFALPAFAVHQLCFLRMQFKLKACQPFPDRFQKMLRFCFTIAMHDDVVCITLKWISCKVPAHPPIKDMVQIQVGKQRADDASLRSAFLPCLNTAICLFYSCFQPAFCVQQHPLLLCVMLHHLHHPFVADIIKESFDV